MTPHLRREIEDLRDEATRRRDRRVSKCSYEIWYEITEKLENILRNDDMGYYDEEDEP